jgi:hypothetical protein
MKFADGINLPNPELIRPVYLIASNYLVFNANIDNLMRLVFDFLDTINLPLLFFMEIPCTAQEEQELRKNNEDSFHHNLYYLRIDDKEVISDILNKYGEVLLHDGLTQFGLLSHELDEIYISKYKVTYIKGNNFRDYVELLEDYDYTRTGEIITPWETFSKENYGTASSIKVNGIDVYYVLRELNKVGMYLYKTLAD